MGTVATLSVRIAANTGDFDKALGKLEGQWKRTGSRLQGIGSSLTAGITVPLVAAAAGLAKIGLEFDHAMDTIRSTTGATGASLQGLGDSFRTVFAQVPNSMADVATAVGSISVRTGQTGKDLEALSRQTLQLSSITGEQLPPLIAATTRVFGDWSIATKDQASSLDFLYKTSQATGIGVTKLSETVVQFGAPLRALGFSFKESAAMIGKWEKEGVNLETVLAGLKFGLGNFAKAGLEPRAALQNVQAAIKGAKTEMEAMAISVKVFGKRAGPDMARAIVEGRFAIDDLVKSIDGSQDTISKAAEATLSLDDKFEILGHKVMVAAEPLATSLVGALEGAINAAMPLSGALAAIGSGFAAMPAPIQTTAVGMLGMAAAVGPVTYLWGGFKTVVGSAMGLLRGLPGALQGALSVLGVFTGPVALVGVGVTAAIVGIKELTGSWTTAFTVMLPPVGMMIAEWDRFKDAIKTVWALISSGPSSNPDVQGGGPGWSIPGGLGPSGSIDDAMALLDSTSGAKLGADIARLSGNGGGLGGMLGGQKKALSEAERAMKAHADAIKKMASDMSGATALKELQDLIEAWHSLPPEIQKSDPVLKHVVDKFVQLGPQLTNIPAKMRPIVGELNDMALAAGKFSEKIEDGISNLADISKAVNFSGETAFNAADMWGSFADVLALETPGLDNTKNRNAVIDAMPDVGKPERSDYVDAQLEASAKETIDGVRKAFQFFTGSLSSGMSALLGGLLNSFEKLASKEGSQLNEFFKSDKGSKFGDALNVGMAAFGGGFGMGEQFGKGKGALGGAASGALSGAMVAGPFGAIVGGLAGLFGGLFGGRAKAKKERAAMADTRNQLVDQFGGMDNLRKQADLAGVSIDLLFSTTKPEVFKAELDKVGDAIKVMQDRIKSTISEVDDVMSKGGIITADLWKKILPDAGADEIKAKLKEVFVTSVNQAAEGFNKIATNFELLKRPISEIGVLAQAAFGGLLTAGASLPEAIAAIEPGLAHLREIMKPGENAGGPLGELLNWQGIIEKNKGLFELLAGTQSMLTGLANSGLLTQQTFGALGATISQAFGQLTAHGVAAATALQMMQPQLQALWQLEKDRGLTLDANTQKMLDQAVQQGIVGPQMASVEQKMLDVMLAIAKVLGADIPAALAGLPAATGAAVDAISPKFQALKDQATGVFSGIPHSIDIDMRLHGSLPPGDLAAALGVSGGTGSHSPTSNDWATHIPHLAAGGIVTRPTTLLAGEAGPEAIVPLNDYMQGGGVNLNIQNVYGDVDEKLVRQIFNKVAIGGSLKTHAQGSLR